ncbi:MAG: cobalt-precorrin-5B (C(1))-methyltransferase [Chloroflexi bacterium]|nr:cobalt-precorrin-5B (C(1))-methyltransferase [Chloroflexota bacterium]
MVEHRLLNLDNEAIPVTGAPPPPRQRHGMRTGFTTGACATATAMAATITLRDQHPLDSVVITLPTGQHVRFLLQELTVRETSASAMVFKDGGDDPDVTHGAAIYASVARCPEQGIFLRGGTGVGTVTRPGLGLAVGESAINPVPRRMIIEHVQQAAGPLLEDGGLIVTIAIPEGERLAAKTLNGRLGIVGGLSILGTTGIVQPFSTAAWRASVKQSIDVAVANGITEVLMSTGGRSEHYGQEIFHLDDMALIEMGEFTGEALRHAVMRGIRIVHMCGMVGKYAKIAQGHFMTHVAGNQVDLPFLATLAEGAAAPPSVVEAIRSANTARHAQELALAAHCTRFFILLCEQTCRRCWEHVNGALTIDALLFDFTGQLLARSRREASPR